MNIWGETKGSIARAIFMKVGQYDLYCYHAVTQTTVQFWCHLWLITVSGAKLDTQELYHHAAVTVTAADLNFVFKKYFNA